MKTGQVLAIDPGTTASGVALIQSDSYRTIWKGKVANTELIGVSFGNILKEREFENMKVVIEMIPSYGTGNAAGKDVYETCIWIGRFKQWFIERSTTVDTITRTSVKQHLCGSTRAKDPNVVQALVDRFAPLSTNYGKGTKKEPGWFYGFKADIWQAYALGVTYLDSLHDNQSK
ncbi:MAG: hypothetical protein VB025_14630 [Sphaerochaeta sp.]|nr:hypothetical protein [Sphaerochaeta sp.]